MHPKEKAFRAWAAEHNESQDLVDTFCREINACELNEWERIDVDYLIGDYNEFVQEYHEAEDSEGLVKFTTQDGGVCWMRATRWED